MNMHRSCCCTTVDAWHFINAKVVQLSLDMSGSISSTCGCTQEVKDWVENLIEKMNAKFETLPEDEKPMIGVDMWDTTVKHSQLPTYDYDSVFDFVNVEYEPSGGTFFKPPIIHHNGVFDNYAVTEEGEGGLCCSVPPDDNPLDYVCDDVDSEQDCMDNYPGRDFQADIEVIEGVAVLFLSDGGSQDRDWAAGDWTGGGEPGWAPLLLEEGVKSAYYTIGLGVGADIAQLELLSSSTGGHNFIASVEGDELNFIVDTLLQQS